MAEYLYIHIPYCVKKCIYCDFLSLPFAEQQAEAYIEVLCRELEIKSALAGGLKTVFVGGGTPTLLPEKSFSRLFSCVRGNFELASEAEISVEANPGTVDASKIEYLMSLGVNRMSIGVQSFHDNELKTLGRIHSAETALKAIGLLKVAGLMNFSIDLMYGIPGQTPMTWKETLEQSTALSPAHISSYELTPEEKTPLARLLRERALTLPEEGSVLEMYDHAIDYLQGKGFEHYEISNFALPGFRCLHNLNYWDRGEYIGAGAGAHSFLQGIRSRNTGDVSAYIDSLKNAVIPEVERLEISTEEALKEFIFLGLRKTAGISLTEALSMRPDFSEAYAELLESGHLALKDSRLRLTRKGLPLSNMVIVQLFERLGL